jgi:diaminohydroxyphosphoribosylaminopyrimidine deaminase/5-amino-6-(5-phosphoribosylamino)uracil reductase
VSAILAPTASKDRADRAHMLAALELAQRGLGQVWPNPAVGCVIVNQGRVVGRGWTQSGGRPHAETEALKRAGAAAKGATAYVTLEPCAHHGKTSPCAEALIAAGISRAVVALIDPDERVSGQGIAKLEEAGIEVSLGLCAEEAEEVNAGFLLRIAEGRPILTLKTATTLDGRIAVHSGASRWITGEAARSMVHRLRANHDAVLIGVGTALADNPELTCRLPGYSGRQPVRIVVDGRLRLPLTSKLVAEAGKTAPTWLITRDGGDKKRMDIYREAGVEIIVVDHGADGRPDLKAAFKTLGERGLTRVMAEAGSHMTASLLRADLVDRLVWFRSPRLIGGDGLPMSVAFGVDELTATPFFTRLSVSELGPDVMETYRRN